MLSPEHLISRLAPATHKKTINDKKIRATGTERKISTKNEIKTPLYSQSSHHTLGFHGLPYVHHISTLYKIGYNNTLDLYLETLSIQTNIVYYSAVALRLILAHLILYIGFQNYTFPQCILTLV